LSFPTRRSSDLFYPDLSVTQLACPLWVPLIENNMHESVPGRMIIQQDVETLLSQDPSIDTILLGCTHYPIVQPVIESFISSDIQLVPQGEIVALSLKDYLHRHQWMENKLRKTGQTEYYTTENPTDFDEKAEIFMDCSIN